MHGKICYIEIPTSDVKLSKDFYTTIFGWTTRERDDGSTAFDDSTGNVSGTWVLGRKASPHEGALVSIMVDDAEATVKMIKSKGGKIVQEIGMDYQRSRRTLRIHSETYLEYIRNQEAQNDRF